MPGLGKGGGEPRASSMEASIPSSIPSPPPLSFEIGSHCVDLAGLEFTEIHPSLLLTLLQLPSGGMKGVHHHSSPASPPTVFKSVFYASSGASVQQQALSSLPLLTLPCPSFSLWTHWKVEGSLGGWVSQVLASSILSDFPSPQAFCGLHFFGTILRYC